MLNIKSLTEMLVRIICGFTIGVLMSWGPIMPTLVATIGTLFYLTFV